MDEQTFQVIGQAEATAANGYAFTTPLLPPASYILVAGTDRDNDDLICDIEDACGFFPDLVTITPGQNTAGLHFIVGDLVAPQSTMTDISRLKNRTFKRLK